MSLCGLAGHRLVLRDLLLRVMTPASELAVRFLPWPDVFVATSYASFLFAVLAMPLGLATLAGTRLPWRMEQGLLR